MELSQICSNLIRSLKSNNNSIKDFREKNNQLDTFCQTLDSRDQLRQDFIKSPYVVELIVSVLDMAVIATQKQTFNFQRFEAVPRFFSYLARNSIPFSKEEKDIQKIINIIIDIIAIHLNSSDSECWMFWQCVFIEMMKVSSFFNMFREEVNDQDEFNQISYAKIDTLYDMADRLMKFNHVFEEGYEKQRSQALIFFDIFLQNSPFPPLPNLIDSFFMLSDKLSEQNLSDKDFSVMLCILNNLIAMSPISFLIRSNSPFNAPFNPKILQTIFEKWQNYQKTPSVRKNASAYLLLFLTAMDAMEYKIEQDFIDKWVKRILEVWSTVYRRSKIFESARDIPYLRADVEFLKRASGNNIEIQNSLFSLKPRSSYGLISNDSPQTESSISRCLLNFILPNNKLNLNSSIVWLFTAIGKYAPTVITQEHWIYVLDNISKFEIAEAALLNQDTLNDFYYLLEMMTNVVKNKEKWNNVFAFLNKKQPTKEQINPYYHLLNKIFEKRQIDTKACHKYQNQLWHAPMADPSIFTIARLKCIHSCIYYYGFYNDLNRNECFSCLISLLDYKAQLSTDYMKQLCLTICSTVLTHACRILPENSYLENDQIESIDDICNKLTKTLAITASKKKKETPLQTEDFFMVTPESSQVIIDENSQHIFTYNIENDEHNNRNNEKNENEPETYALCNFIDSESQKRMIQIIEEKTIPYESNAKLFKLFLTSLMPNFFSPIPFFSILENDFTSNCTPDNFPIYARLFLNITEEINGEDFQPFFEDIDSYFFEVASQFIQKCESEIRSDFKDTTSISWHLLKNTHYRDYYDSLPILAEFSVKCSQLAVGTGERFYEIFQDFLSISNWIPHLHLKICFFLLKLPLTDTQTGEIIQTLEYVTTRILETLLVPVKERENFLDILLSENFLEFDNSEPMEDLIKTISKYSLTPHMKQILLRVMKENYQKANQIFDYLWNSRTPFFILDDYSNIRLQSIDAIISILKLKELVINDEAGLPSRMKFDKEAFFKDFVMEYLNDILCEEDWEPCKQAVFTALKTLIAITSDIPELSIKSLFLIFNAFTSHNISIFPLQCLNVLFSGLSSRVHFSLFLRQFIPMIVPQFVKLEEKFALFPFELFFYDDKNLFSNNSISRNIAKRMFCIKAAPHAISYASANSNQSLIQFFSDAMNVKTKDIFQENAIFICSYMLEICYENVSESSKQGFREIFNTVRRLLPGYNFNSPLPLLSFISMATEQSIFNAYEEIIKAHYYSPEFVDIRIHLFSLYSTIFRAHHELIQSFYLQQFSLYTEILFSQHVDYFEEKPTLYSDILALTVNLIQFAPASQSSKLLNTISQHIPNSFSMKMVGFIHNIEDICFYLGNHSSLNQFFLRFPKLVDKILLFDFLKDTQLVKRTAYNEFKRIGKTQRLNNESINFLLKKIIEEDLLNSNDKSLSKIDLLSNDLKRATLYKIYQFSVQNPETLALHLYSELFLRFIHIHPSPLAIKNDINPSINLFIKILEFARDKNPSLNRSALTALHQIISNKMLPNQVISDKILFDQLKQYKEFSNIRKNVKKPDSSSPWICRFVCGIIGLMKPNSLCSTLASIASASPDFCKELFPHLFVESLNEEIVSHILHTFKQFAKNPIKHLEECRLFISGFNYLRELCFDQNLNFHPHNDQEWHLRWGGIQLDFSLIMKVCLDIGDPYSAYQFAEFAHEVYNISSNDLKNIFTHLGVDDLQYGLNVDFSNPIAVAELHTQEGRMNRALVLADSSDNTYFLSETLRSLKLYRLLERLNMNNLDSLWRLRQWHLPSEIAQEINNISYISHLSNCFLHSNTNDFGILSNDIEKTNDQINGIHSAGLFNVMQAFASFNEEAINEKLYNFKKAFRFSLNSSINEQLSNLLDASTLNWFHAVFFYNSHLSSSNNNNFTNLHDLFPQDILNLYRKNVYKINNLSNHFYKITENSNALNGVFLCINNSSSSINSKSKRNSPISPSFPPEFFSGVISHARDCGEIESAQYFITLLRDNQKMIPQYANFEQIQILALDNPYHAIALLENNYMNLILNESQGLSNKRRNIFNLRVELARAYLSANTNYKTSEQIFSQLKTVIKQAKNIDALELEADAEFILAKYYHQQHIQICNYFSSAEYNTIIEIIQCGKQLIDGKTRISSTLRTTKQDVMNYESIIEQHKFLFSQTIVKAIKNYMNALLHSNKYDLEATFSIVGLWFDYSYTKYKPFVQEVPDLIPTIEKTFPDVDPIKFLPLFYQLAARVDYIGEISSTQSSDYNLHFQEVLREMVSSICKKSPYESFPVLFALTRNDTLKNRPEGISINTNKIDAINELVQSITNSSPDLLDHWNQFHKMLGSYLILANAPQMSNQEASLSKLAKNRFSQCISSIMPKLTIITHTGSEVGINQFRDRITILNGVNHPMLLTIEGIDGNIYKQIVKGNKDDLRQDAVMQQLFTLSSKLLNQRNKFLSIRHYKVIPLSPTCGVIEFVENSISIQDYLYKKVDKEEPEGAHTRYYISKFNYNHSSLLPYERALHTFHSASNAFHSKEKTKEKERLLIDLFKKIRTKIIHPVFRFFFIERFPNTCDWFSSRLRYCRHTATNSIVGYILGIGDRHLNNILIDESTGEIIHIDLGIAFDQGKALPIMEKVPFRLTNEIIDGMGWMGKEGIFRKTCEESMKVLRKNSEYLITILKVFMSDPLYNWNLIPKKQRDSRIGFNEMRATGESKNQFAESVIVTCRRKLEGRVTGETLSAEGQISMLINDATSDENLAFMYSGWKPFL